jgi:hypothetical protein
MKRTFGAALFTLLAITTPASAATFDLDFTGTVGLNSVDTEGLFGTPNASLTGDNFSANFYYAIPSATLRYPNAFSTAVDPLSYTLTINNQTLNSAAFGPITGFIQGASPANISPVGIIADATTPLTTLILSLLSPNIFPSGQPNLGIPFSYTRQPDDSQLPQSELAIDGSNGPSIFPVENINFDVESVSISPVPLPAALPLFGSSVIALAGLAYTKRRREVST